MKQNTFIIMIAYLKTNGTDYVRISVRHPAYIDCRARALHYLLQNTLCILNLLSALMHERKSYFCARFNLSLSCLYY